jgi:PilZ domain.
MQRYVAVPPLQADFCGYPVLVYNLAEGGLQVEHAAPFKLGLHGKARVSLPAENRQLVLVGEVVWSRLSRTPDEKGKYLYRSGVRIDLSTEEARNALRYLITTYARPDLGTLERKRQAMLERARSIARRPGVKTQQFGPSIPNDVVLLIQQAIERLRMHPDEAAKWYNRAKFSVSQKEDGTVDELLFHYKEDVLAVWEYLERTIDVNVISKVYGMKK